MIEKIFIISFIVFAIHYTMQEGEIFGKLGQWFERNLPDALHSPVYECPVCMVPYYGSALYWLFWANNWQEWLVVIIAAMGLNAVLNKMFPPDEIEVKEDKGLTYVAEKYNVPGGEIGNGLHMIVAEGFVAHLGAKKRYLEHVAEDYIQEYDNQEGAAVCFGKIELLDEIIKEINE